MSPFTYADLARCAQREVGQRKKVYPRLIAGQRMTQQMADRETAMMEEIARRLKEMADVEDKAGRLL